MSLLDNQTRVTPGTNYYGSGGGGGGGGSFSTINVSTIDIQANGDINWDGSINFQGTNGGYVSFLSSIAGDNAANGIQITGSASNATSTIGLWVGGDGKAYFQPTTPSRNLNMPGVNIQELSTLQAQNVSLSSINGAAYPPPPAESYTVNPIQTYTYVPPGGATTACATIPTLVSNNWYQISGTLRLSVEPSTATVLAADNLGFTFLGNFNSFANNLTTSLATVSTLQNDVYQNFSIVAKANNNSAAGFAAYTNLGTTYSTMVGLETPLVITNLGAF